MLFAVPLSVVIIHFLLEDKKYGKSDDTDNGSKTRIYKSSGTSCDDGLRLGKIQM